MGTGKHSGDDGANDDSLIEDHPTRCEALQVALVLNDPAARKLKLFLGLLDGKHA
jgi:hypothetical protein